MGPNMLNTFKNVLQQLKNQCLVSEYECYSNQMFQAGWFQFLFTRPEVNPQQIHLDKGICNVDRRFDIVLALLTWESTNGPSIQPQLVVGVRIFRRIGFTDPRQ